MRAILSVEDLSTDDVGTVLDRARMLEADGWPPHGDPFLASLLFLTPSLRTRAGFAAATARLGGAVVDVSERRGGPTMSSSESVQDTLRTLAGYADVLVVRCDQDLAAIVRSVDLGSTTIVNGGDRGHHPTQALIDLATIQRSGPASSLRIGISGDLSARVVRSLLDLLAIDPPDGIVLAGPRSIAVCVPDALVPRTTRCDELDPAGLDVVYLAGMPRVSGGHVFELADRLPFALGPHNIDRLSPAAAILCPLPMIDEVDPTVRSDPRMLAFAQSDRGQFVRAALLERVLGRL